MSVLKNIYSRINRNTIWSISILGFFSLVIGLILSHTAYASSYVNYPYKLFFVLLICYFIKIYFFIAKQPPIPEETVFPHTQNSNYNKKYVCLVALSVVIVYVGISLLLYSAWMKDDEFAFAYRHKAYFGYLYSAFQRYTNFVSRIGDLFIHICPLGSNRWQVFLITPLIPALTPFALHRLVSVKRESLFNFYGLNFYWISVVLLLTCVYLTSWRSYFCYAANANYLWPSALLVLFLSFYNKYRWSERDDRITMCIVLFVLGLIIAWSQECLAVVLLPSLTLWGAYHIYTKKYMPNSCFYGYLGTIMGAFMLFSAPALKSRLAIEAPRRAIDISAMSENDYHHFITNLDWDKVNLFKGPTNVINFMDVPVFDRLYFIPFLCERYWECCVVTTSVLLILLVAYSVIKHKKGGFFYYSGTVIFASCSILSALAYSYSCIPGRWSFTVCGFLLVIACAYLVQGISKTSYSKIIIPIITGCLTVYMLSIFVPAGIEAVSLKKYDLMRTAEIIKQREAGLEHIQLQYPVPYKPKDTLGLMGIDYMKEDPQQGYTNQVAAGYYEVKTISQKPFNKKTD